MTTDMEAVESPPSQSDSAAGRREAGIVLLIALAQFVNMVDFVMVMPLGPDFARALGIPTSQLGALAGSYTLSAAIAGFAGAFFLDRFDRRPALTVALIGLAFGTASAALATDYPTLLLARVLAGIFGGPATAIAGSILTDVVPVARRGRAMGIVMSSFSAASVVGVPAGLELARLGGWRSPFLAIGALAVLVAAAAYSVLPPLGDHRERDARTDVWSGFAALLARPATFLAYAVMGLSMGGAFVLIPSIAPFVLGNLEYPREHLSTLYLAGGLFSLFTVPMVGRLVDRWGAFVVSSAGTALYIFVVWLCFVRSDLRTPVLFLFVALFFCAGARNVGYAALTSRVPMPPERASFMSLESTVRHLSTALGAYISSLVLRDGPHETLLNIDSAAWIAIAAAIVSQALVLPLERAVTRTERANTQLAPSAG